MSTMAMEEEPSFSSLPHDIVLNVLAHVPRRYHPILCSVSKKLRSLVRSSEFHKTRSLMGKEYCFYVCIKEIESPSLVQPYHWFTLTENRRLVSIPFPSPPEPYYDALMVGPEIYFVGSGSSNNPSRSMWILDSRSGKLRQGPSSLVASRLSAVGIVDEKIYIFGGWCQEEEIKAQVFDPKRQTWGVAANPSVEVNSIRMSVVSPSLHRKIYARNGDGKVITVYDPRDGNCKIIKLPADYYYRRTYVCVIDYVLYIYYPNLGLMWYNPKEKEWRVVSGLEFNMHFSTVMAEYNGKLAFLWHERKKMEIWCALISLHRNGVAEVQGQVEWCSCLLSDVPSTYYIMHCLGRTD